MASSTDYSILAVARLFTNEITKLEAHRSGTHLSLTLHVELKGWGEDAKPILTLKGNFRDPHSSSFSSNTVEASTVDKLLAEIKRRLAFEDREAVEMSHTNNQLAAIAYSPPSPSEDEDDGEPLNPDFSEKVPF